MGNCIRHESSTVWAGEDWSSVISKKTVRKDNSCSSKMKNNLQGSQKYQLQQGHSRNARSSTEMKIRITKRELEDLLVKVDLEGISLEQALTRYMKVGDNKCHTQNPSSQSALQSISEAD
ncbi:hypothetical protein FRX31_031652 [Thalictrum thalictroides]|uniref:Uncharacterized protein n=1 Tax=Thalictrum thalictroides TaxID=46969 RepID=A0A7J6V1T1_THATH|nr:hypothetical protein FRX31_031652 [Thalictrum thalictroides]